MLLNYGAADSAAHGHRLAHSKLGLGPCVCALKLQHADWGRLLTAAA